MLEAMEELRAEAEILGKGADRETLPVGRVRMRLNWQEMSQKRRRL